MEDVSRLEITQLSFSELTEEEYTEIRSLRKRAKTGRNLQTLKPRISLEVSDYAEIDSLLESCKISRGKTQLSYTVVSTVCWGNFTIPPEGIYLSSKYNISLKVHFMTPPKGAMNNAEACLE